MPNRPATITKSLLAAVLISLIHAGIAGAVGVQAVKFNIAEQQLSDALVSFARQAGVSIIFSGGSEFDSRLTQSYSGEFSINAMLTQLLDGTMLEAEFIHSDVIAIRPKPCILSNSCEHRLSRKELADLASNPRLEQMLIIGKTLTGSRLRRTDFNGSAPVDIISAFDIELAGAQSVGDLLRDLPSVVGNSTSTSVSNGGDGTASVTLRGLPATNTLVLLNGRRVANDGLAGESFDLNSVAPSSIERIEVLKSGSSAVYGSDAIAGVINIILKKEFDGFQLDSYSGQSNVGDQETNTSSFSFGRVFDRASFFMGGNIFDQKGIFSRDRVVSGTADLRPLGGPDNRSSATPNARVTLPGQGALILDEPAGEVIERNDYRPASNEDLFNYAEFTSSIVPSQRKSLYANLNFDVNDSTAGYVDLGYTSNKARSVLAPTPLFSGFETIPLPISANNVFNPFGVEIVDLRKRLLELEPREQYNSAHTKRAAVGLEGVKRDVRWDFSWHWSQSKANETLSNLIDANRLQRALGSPANCAGAAVDGCVPVNVFGPSGSLSQAQQDYLLTSSNNTGFFKLYGAALNTAFTLAELPAGRLDVALGVDYRKESTLLTPTVLNQITIGGSNLAPSSGSRSVRELYYEATVPLLKHKASSHRLSVELAGRYSNYSDFGETFNPRYALRYTPLKGLIFRASYAEGFRAPSLLELHQSSGENQAFLTDPCSIASNVSALPGCTVQTDNTRLQYLTINGGNRVLEPEESEFTGLGAIWNAGKQSHFSFSMDYFQIKQKNVIDANAQFILDQNAANQAFLSRVERAPNGEIERIIATNINIGRRTLKGVDFSASYALPTAKRGRLHFSLNASRLLSYKEQLNPNQPFESVLGSFVDEAAEGRGSLPKWKGNVGLYWKHKQWQANYTIHYIDSLQEFIAGTNSYRNISSWTTHKLQTSYLFLIADGLRFTLGVNNIFDEDPPVVFTAFNDNIDARTHNLIGRYWYVKLAQKF